MSNNKINMYCGNILHKIEEDDVTNNSNNNSRNNDTDDFIEEYDTDEEDIINSIVKEENTKENMKETMQAIEEIGNKWTNAINKLQLKNDVLQSKVQRAYEAINILNKTTTNDAEHTTLNDTIMLNNKLKSMDAKLDNILKIIEKMSNHIDFVETTYDSFKAPLNWIKNTVDSFGANTIPTINK